MRSTRQRSKAQAGMESPMSTGHSPMSTGHADPEVQMQEQEEEPQESAGENALVAAVNGAAVEITVRIAKARLHCPGCTLPLKPPIFHCAFGHLACSVCHLTIGGGGDAPARCLVCGDGGGYARSTAMEDIVRSAKVLCPHDAYGCGTYVTYYDAAEHQRACPHAPCLCSEPGCGFAGAPAALRDHLAGAHGWPVDGVRYGAALRLRVPDSDPAQHRRLLAAGGDGEGGDGAVFFLAVGALGAPAPPLLVVSLVCARPKAAAAEGPRYACTIRAVAVDADAAAEEKGSEESVVLEKTTVPSSASPGETSMDDAASLVMLRRSVPGAAPQEMDITVRIDKIV